MLLIKWNAFANSESSFTVIVDLNTPSRIPSEAVLNPLWLRTWWLREEPFRSLATWAYAQAAECSLPALFCLTLCLCLWCQLLMYQINHPLPPETVKDQFGPEASVYIHTRPVELWALTPCVPFVFEDSWEMSALTFRTGSHCQSHKCLSCRYLCCSCFPSLGLSSHGRIKSDAQFFSSFRSSASRSRWPWMQEKAFKRDGPCQLWQVHLVMKDCTLKAQEVDSDSSQSNGYNGKWKGRLFSDSRQWGWEPLLRGQWEPGGMAGGSNSVSVTHDNSMPTNSHLQGQIQT